MAVGLLFGVEASGFLAPRGVPAGELVGVFSTPWRGLCSGLKATREGPVGLTRMLLSVFLNSVAGESKATRYEDPFLRPSRLPQQRPTWVPHHHLALAVAPQSGAAPPAVRPCRQRAGSSLRN